MTAGEGASGRVDGGERREVEISLSGALEGVWRRDDPHLLAVLVDQANLGHADPLVDTSTVALRRTAVEARDRH